MKQRQMILAVVGVGLVAVAAWVWHENSQQPEAPQPAKVTALQDAFHQSSAAPAASEPAQAEASASSPQPAPPPAAAPEVQQPAVSAPPEPPASVDTPEPAQRKFARGGRPDESDRTE